MSQHTPGPWTQFTDSASTEYEGHHQGGALIFSTAGSQSIPAHIRKANAAFICEACNAYESDKAKIDALVKALEYALAYAAKWHTQLPGDFAHIARAALELAGEA